MQSPPWSMLKKKCIDFSSKVWDRQVRAGNQGNDQDQGLPIYYPFPCVCGLLNIWTRSKLKGEEHPCALCLLNKLLVNSKVQDEAMTWLPLHLFQLLTFRGVLNAGSMHSQQGKFGQPHSYHLRVFCLITFFFNWGSRLGSRHWCTTYIIVGLVLL